jgi:hypothetical protein
MIDGLKLTLSGEELRTLLARRADEHRQMADSWKQEASRTPEQQTEEAPLLPEHMCEYEAERHEWRAEVLDFLSEHLEPVEVYRLDEADLEFGELLPRKPGALEQEEYEERNRVGFGLERLVRRVNHCPEIFEITNPEPKRAISPAASAP